LVKNLSDFKDLGSQKEHTSLSETTGVGAADAVVVGLVPGGNSLTTCWGDFPIFAESSLFKKATYM
jgi:hypothetical protein